MKNEVTVIILSVFTLTKFLNQDTYPQGQCFAPTSSDLSLSKSHYLTYYTIKNLYLTFLLKRTPHHFIKKAMPYHFFTRWETIHGVWQIAIPELIMTSIVAKIYHNQHIKSSIQGQTPSTK